VGEETEYNLTVYPASRLVQVRWGERQYSSGIMVSINNNTDITLDPGIVIVKYNESGVYLVQ